ncbi:hypothetical protein V7200_08585 [Cytobacillus firmus]|uniref:hypothetical protein n=1 Tax=Cytobacillus firmus TaxID=1399 RepID=UPI002FFE5323
MKEKNKMHCPVCSNTYKLSDKVILDINNTVFHIECFNHQFSPKQLGIFIEVIAGNEIFHEFLPVS